MFSYTYEIRLISHRLADDAVFSNLDLDGFSVSMEHKEGGSLLISSTGHPSRDAAAMHFSVVFMRLKVALVKMSVAHLDWYSLSEVQQFATNAIGSIFEDGGIVPAGYKPKIYETGRFVHWPGAVAQNVELSPEALFAEWVSDCRFNIGSIRVLEALTVLGLALADPHAKSKLILSMTAIEVLIERRPVDEGLLRTLDRTKALVAEMVASDEHKERISRALDDAGIESILKAGKRLVKEHLGKKRAREFYRLYEIRCEFVHGNPSRFTVDLDRQSGVEKCASEGFRLALDLALSIPA